VIWPGILRRAKWIERFSGILADLVIDVDLLIQVPAAWTSQALSDTLHFCDRRNFPIVD
jgi:hypothetical protein